MGGRRGALWGGVGTANRPLLFAQGQRAVPGQALVIWPGRAARSSRHIHLAGYPRSPPCWTPLGLFQAPGEDTIHLARQGYGPRPLGPLCPGALALHAVVTHAHHQATSHLRAGWPARILLSQPPLQGDPHVGDHCAGATGPLLPGPKPAFCQLLPHPEGGNQSCTAILTLPRGPHHPPASRHTILLWARSQNPTLPGD